MCPLTTSWYALIYDANALRCLTIVQAHTLTGNTKILTLELTPDESVLFTGAQDGDISMWRLDSYQCAYYTPSRVLTSPPDVYAR